MLENEQHILPVDLLFDDEQIGDFVKSIQIDSPYQQMLLEGVLTESVRDEKLYVSFTVEGYFHYVLGEVIYNRTEGLGAETLKFIVEENKLNGVKEGVEQCLIRDVLSNKFERIFWLIDNGLNSIEICSIPLSHAFLKNDELLKSEDDINKSIHSQSLKVLKGVFKNFTDNDIYALTISLDYLKKTQKHNHLKIIYNQINKILVPKDEISLILYIDSLSYVDINLREKQINKLTNWIDKTDKKVKLKNENFLSIINPSPIIKIRLSRMLKDNGYYDKAFFVLEDKFFKSKKCISELKIEYYDLIGDIFNADGRQKDAKRYYIRCLNEIKSCKNINFISLAECYHNIATTTYLIEGINEKVIKLYEKSIDIICKNLGLFHEKYSYVLSNFSVVLSKSTFNYSQLAIDQATNSILINSKLYGNSSEQMLYPINCLLGINSIFFSTQQFEWTISFMDQINFSNKITSVEETALKFGGWYRTFIKKLIESNCIKDLKKYTYLCLKIENNLYNQNSLITEININFEIGVLYFEIGDIEKSFNYLTYAARKCIEKNIKDYDYENIIEYLFEIVNNKELNFEMPKDILV
jgi:tetratricopeptide (TPR) repeat protein